MPFGITILAKAKSQGPIEPFRKENHVMLKKHTLFFDKSLMEAIPFCNDQRKADHLFDFVTKLTKTVAIGRNWHFDLKDGAAGRFFKGLVSSQTFFVALDKAKRVETLLTHGHHCIRAVTYFYRKGCKDHFFMIDAGFNEEGCIYFLYSNLR